MYGRLKFTVFIDEYQFPGTELLSCQSPETWKMKPSQSLVPSGPFLPVLPNDLLLVVIDNSNEGQHNHSLAAPITIE